MMTTPAYEKIFTCSELDFKAIIGDGGAMWVVSDSQEFMAITPARTDLDRYRFWISSVRVHLRNSQRAS